MEETDLLAAATAAYHDAQTALDGAETALATARTLRERRRLELAEAIREAARAGRPQVEIVRVTGYQREQIRRICKAGEDQEAA